MHRHLALTLSALLVACLPITALAAEVQVRMLQLGANGEELVFEPALNTIAVGDIVTFVPGDKTLNVESIAQMLPPGAAPLKGVPGKRLSFTFTVPGVYGLKSAAQYENGMVGLIVVGDVALQGAEARGVNPVKAKARFDAMFASLQ
jgi:pseudoazurin